MCIWLINRINTRSPVCAFDIFSVIVRILDLKNQIRLQYKGDFSHAPESVQDFMKETNVTQQAIKLGLYDPDSIKESALIREGTILKFDEQGNILFGKPDASGNIPVLEKYHGPMLDSDQYEPAPASDIVEKAPDAPKGEVLEPATASETKPEPIAEPEPVETPKSITAEEAKEAVMRKMDTANDEGIKELYNSVRGMDNAHPEYILELLPRQIYILNHYPEFALNTENLSIGKLLQAIELSEKNISVVFLGEPGVDTDSAWNMVKEIPTEKAMSAEFLKDFDTQKSFGPFVKYLHKLKELTGLEPETNVFRTAETNEHYVARAIQKVIALGKVEELEASLAK